MKKTTEMKVHSVRLPVRVWTIMRRLANQNYRSLNNQVLKIVEDWMVDRGYLEDSERTTFEDPNSGS
ncbi:MAG: Arc family DNA-binding protein [Candidatus Neomarinimicrobiota bacterium]|nr:MAG: Arc family DNA-binding protein [Candidatus Neomarinimicrobiota bacterium]